MKEQFSMHPHRPHAQLLCSRSSVTAASSYKRVKGRSHTVEKRSSKYITAVAVRLYGTQSALPVRHICQAMVHLYLLQPCIAWRYV